MSLVVKMADWPKFRDSLPKSELLIDPLIPAKAKTLLHGPPGSGKSALGWGILNAVSQTENYLGLPVVQTRGLLLSTDMNWHELKQRWGENFIPRFDIVCLPRLNCTEVGFRSKDTYKQVKDYVVKEGIGLIMIDAIGGIHSGRKASDDDTADEVDRILDEWFPGVAIIEIGHDRKLKHDINGKPFEPGEEDFLGSQKWRANATSQVHMWATNKFYNLSYVIHEKSQVTAKMDERIKVYIDTEGQAVLYNEHQVSDVLKKLDEARRAIPELATAGKEQGDILMAAYFKVSAKTVQRWRSIAKRTVSTEGTGPDK